MLKSKFTILGFWFIALATVFTLFLLISAISKYYFSIQLFNIEIRTKGEAFFQIIVFLVFSIILLPTFLFNATFILIDTTGKTITFKNYFSKKQRHYLLDEIEGYVDSSYRARFSSEYNVLYIVKAGKRVEKISSYYYSNYTELKEGLGPLAYLGYRNFDQIKNLKILFRQNVLD